jgi:hypothetical protein
MLTDALDAWLDELHLTGAAAVRAQLARKLAETIAEAPAYVVARCAAELSAVIESLDVEPSGRELDLRALLGDVAD